MKLTIELVPSTSFYNNVRALLTQAQWDIVRKQVYAQAWHLCQICGGKGPKHPVEAHEIWEYDDKRHIQKLAGMIALCPACHQVKHIGLAQLNGQFDKALTHLMKVNKITKPKAITYIKTQFELWASRSEFDWKLDVATLKDYGIDIKKLKVSDGRSKKNRT